MFLPLIGKVIGEVIENVSAMWHIRAHVMYSLVPMYDLFRSHCIVVVIPVLNDFSLSPPANGLL